MSLPRVPAYQPLIQEKAEANPEVGEGSQARVNVFGDQLSPIYGNGEQGQGNSGQGDDAEEALARLLAGSDSGQIKAWASNIERHNAQKSHEFFPSTNPLKFIGPNATPVAYQLETLSEINRHSYGAYVPYPTNHADMTPLSGNEIEVAGKPFNLTSGVDYQENDYEDEDAIPMDWQYQMDGEWRQTHVNTGPAGGGSYNRTHLAMGRFSMNNTAESTESTLFS